MMTNIVYYSITYYNIYIYICIYIYIYTNIMAYKYIYIFRVFSSYDKRRLRARGSGGGFVHARGLIIL